MFCNSCGDVVSENENLCEKCSQLAKTESYAECAKCGKISVVFADMEPVNNRKIYTTTCRTCEGNINEIGSITTVYENPCSVK
jgi:hypothetical protein